MTLTFLKPIALAALLVSAPAVAQNEQQAVSPEDAALASDAIAQGHSLQAISMLEAELARAPNDPALLINLGIANAHIGNDAKARECFETVMTSREVIELETADGTEMDSRRLARRALAMLDRGEFRPDRLNDGRLVLRD